MRLYGLGASQTTVAGQGGNYTVNNPGLTQTAPGTFSKQVVITGPGGRQEVHNVTWTRNANGSWTKTGDFTLPGGQTTTPWVTTVGRAGMTGLGCAGGGDLSQLIIGAVVIGGIVLFAMGRH